METNPMMSSAVSYVYEQLQNGKWTVKDLNSKLPSHRQGFYQYVKNNHRNLLTELKDEHDKPFLENCLKMDPMLFIYLKPDQYTEEWASKYLVERINKTDAKSGFLTRSFEHKLMFNTYYSTHEGEQIFYYDNDLKTQLFLIAKIHVVFKVKDAIQFLKKLDVDVQYIGYNGVKQALLDWVNTAYRRVILQEVGAGNSGIYKLNVKHEELEKAIQNELTAILSDGGLLAEKVSIKQLSLVDETAKLLERHGLEYLIEQRRQDLEIEYEKASLVNYEKKAAIHSANPDFTPTLTEAEKDFALNRYIRKSKFEGGELQEIKLGKLKDRQTGSDDILKKQADVPTRKKENKWFIWLYVVAAVWFIFAFASLPSTAKCLLGLAFGVLSFGLGIFFTMGYKEQSKQDASQAEYNAQLQELEEMKKNGSVE